MKDKPTLEFQYAPVAVSSSEEEESVQHHQYLCLFVSATSPMVMFIRQCNITYERQNIKANLPESLETERFCIYAGGGMTLSER